MTKNYNTETLTFLQNFFSTHLTKLVTEALVKYSNHISYIRSTHHYDAKNNSLYFRIEAQNKSHNETFIFENDVINIIIEDDNSINLTIAFMSKLGIDIVFNNRVEIKVLELVFQEKIFDCLYKNLHEHIRFYLTHN